MPLLNLSAAIMQLAPSVLGDARASGSELTREFVVDHANMVNTDAGRVFRESRDTKAAGHLYSAVLFEAQRHGDSHLLPGRGQLGPANDAGVRTTNAGHVRVSQRWRTPAGKAKQVKDGFDVVDVTGVNATQAAATLTEAKAAAAEMQSTIARRIASETAAG